MQCRTLLLLTALGSSTACWAQGTLSRTGPLAILDGAVIAFETGDPVPRAEVCVFGGDTTCVRADPSGRYRTRVPAGTVTVRFRTPGLPLAVVRDVELTPGATVHLSCAMSGRLSLAEEIACLPVASR